MLRLFALALADGSGLPFSLHPPPAALESQTPQREARALPRRAPKLTASERKIVTKETHQGCVFVQVAFALQRRGEGAPAPRTEFAKVRAAVKPAGAGCPHPSRRGAAPHRATFPKGKAMCSVCLAPHGGAEVRTLYTAPFAKAGNKKPGGAGLLL